MGGRVDTDAAQRSTAARERIRAHSKTLFGNRDTLEVAVAVARSEDGCVNATDIGIQLTLAPNRVRAQLTSFVELGYMSDTGTVGGKRWFLRRDDRFWTMCVELYEDWGR
jgi:hypothetical protein